MYTELQYAVTRTLLIFIKVELTSGAYIDY